MQCALFYQIIKPYILVCIILSNHQISYSSVHSFYFWSNLSLQWTWPASLYQSNSWELDQMQPFLPRCQNVEFQFWNKTSRNPVYIDSLLESKIWFIVLQSPIPGFLLGGGFCEKSWCLQGGAGAQGRSLYQVGFVYLLYILCIVYPLRE